MTSTHSLLCSVTFQGLLPSTTGSPNSRQRRCQDLWQCCRAHGEQSIQGNLQVCPWWRGERLTVITQTASSDSTREALGCVCITTWEQNHRSAAGAAGVDDSASTFLILPRTTGSAHTNSATVAFILVSFPSHCYLVLYFFNSFLKT